KEWDQDEWDKLYGAVTTWRRPDFPIKLRVVVGQEELNETVEAIQKGDAKKGIKGDGDLELFVVPKSAFELRKAIEDFGPHLIHFFCHGKNDNGVPRLELARITDWDEEDPARWKSSVQLNIDDFLQIKGIGGCWLVTLNCCEGSKATKDQPSLSFALVT